MAGPSKQNNPNEEVPLVSMPFNNHQIPSDLKRGSQNQPRSTNTEPEASNSLSVRSSNPLHPVVKLANNFRQPTAEGSSTATLVKRQDLNLPKKNTKDMVINGGRGGSSSRRNEMIDCHAEVPPMKDLNVVKSWDLRNQRSVRRNGGRRGNESMLSLLRREEEEQKGEERRAPFSLTLTKEEIEADFLAMTGAKPPKKPKRRIKSAQKIIDNVLPGISLKEVTIDDYQIPDNKDKFKDQEG